MNYYHCSIVFVRWLLPLFWVAIMACCYIAVPARAEHRCVPSAHRGEHTRASGNSIEAIRAAAGIPYIEIDIRGTADNELVLFHDRRLSSTNVRGGDRLLGQPISSLSREELNLIRLPDGSRIPKLRMVLREVQGGSGMLMLDIKSASPRDYTRVMGEVEEVGAESHVVVQCPTKAILQFMRSRYPKVAVLARAHAPAEVESLLKHSPEYVQVDHDWGLERSVGLIHAKGARVVVKTLKPGTDQPVTWRQVCGAGVDVVLTDRSREFLASDDR
jgi:glycerophosphoryl diester phosphodiesterase